MALETDRSIKQSDPTVASEEKRLAPLTFLMSSQALVQRSILWVFSAEPGN